MKSRPMPRRGRILVAAGLLLAASPVLLKEFIPVQDFLRGFIEGLGLAIEFWGLIQIVRARKAAASC